MLVPAKPTLLKRTDLYELWFKQDDQFFTPHGSINVCIQMLNRETTPMSYLLTTMVCNIVNDTLDKAYSYAAQAGNTHKIDIIDNVLVVHVHGYSHRLLQLLETIMKGFKSLKVNPDMFDTHIVKMDNDLSNRVYADAMDQALAYVDILNKKTEWPCEVLFKELEYVTLDLLQSFIDDMFNETYVKMLISGNYVESQALDTTSMVSNILHSQPMLPVTYRYFKVHDFEPGYFIQQIALPNKYNKNNAVACNIYCGSNNNIHEWACLKLIKYYCNDESYDQLKTMEQLGYWVRVDQSQYGNGKFMLAFSVQGDLNPAYVTKRIDRFIAGFRQKIVNMRDDTFTSLVDGVVGVWGKRYGSVDDESKFYLRRILENIYNFDKRDADIEYLQSLEKKDLLEFWDKYINPDISVGYTRIDTQVWTQKHWQPSQQDFGLYSQAMLGLHGCLQSLGTCAINLPTLNAIIFQLANDYTQGQDLTEQFKKLYLEKLPAVKDKKFVIPKGNQTIIVNSLRMVVEDVQSTKDFGTLCKTNLANLRMIQSPEGCWLINNIDSFKRSQGYHGQPLPVRKSIPKYN